MLQFQGRGKTYLIERNSATGALIGIPVEICQDEFAVGLSTESFEHINKCGAVDVPDYRGMRSSSGELTLTYVDVESKKFAIGMLGTVNAAAGSPATVTDEELPAGMVAGDVWFAGGSTMHRNLTSVVLKDSASPQATLVLNTDYSVDAVTGKITILDPTGHTQPYLLSYSHQDPASVSMLTAPQKEWFVRFEGINKANSNAKGAVELYRVRFDPAQNADFLSDELQIMSLRGTVLADDTKESDDPEFGQFGRRIGF